jgi:hypothetical protein
MALGLREVERDPVEEAPSLLAQDVKAEVARRAEVAAQRATPRR